MSVLIKMLWQIVVLSLILWKLYVRYKSHKIIKLAKLFKNDYKPLPLIGHTHLFIGNGEDRMRGFKLLGRQAIKHGGITSVWLGNRFFAMVVDPVVLDLVMKSSLEKDDIMQFAREVTGNGTVFAPVSVWRPRRKVLAPTFSAKNLSQFVNIFSRQSRVMVKLLQKPAGTGVFSIWKYLTTYSMDSVCETTLGVKVHAQLQPDQPFLRAFERGCQLVAGRIVKPWLYPNSVYKMLPYYGELMRCKKTLCSFIDKVIAAKRKSLELEEHVNGKNQEHKEDEFKTFLDLLIDNSGGSQGYSDMELQEETLMIVMAGTDTSAVGASFTAVMLSKYSEVQEKVYQELQEVFGDSDRPIVMEDLLRLKYMDAVVRETLRLYPPVPVIVRKIEKDLKLPSGATLVDGCGVIVNVWATHRNPQYWGEDAELFRPERFIDSPLKHPAAFQVFSYGPRLCMGYQYAMMSIKTAIAALVRKYRILPAVVPSSKTPQDTPLQVTFDIMMKDVNRFNVRLEIRKW